MTFGEKLKQLRKEKNYSQEELAEKLSVSRQAVTKWETDAGTPDIENIKAISALFGVSLDELILGKEDEESDNKKNVTQYFIDAPKHFDINLGNAKKLYIESCEGEIFRIVLSSDTITAVDRNFTVKFDDNRSKIDVDVFKNSNVSETETKEGLIIHLYLPKKLVLSMEISINADSTEINDIECDDIEFDAKINTFKMNKVNSKVQLNCSLDMTIICDTLEKSLDINQISAVSKLYLPENALFYAVAKGKNVISYENGEDFSSQGSDKIIELNGKKSELLICRIK